jgi:hypothetical protein
MGRINIVKLAILPKSIYKCKAVATKIPTQFFTDLEREIHNFIWKNKRPRITKTILNNKRTSEIKRHPSSQAVLHSSSNKKLHDIGIKADRLVNGIKLETQK